MKNFQIQKKKKIVGRKLYSIFSKWSLVTTVFFFSLFSFGNLVHADTQFAYTIDSAGNFSAPPASYGATADGGNLSFYIEWFTSHNESFWTSFTPISSAWSGRGGMICETAAPGGSSWTGSLSGCVNPTGSEVDFWGALYQVDWGSSSNRSAYLGYVKIHITAGGVYSDTSTPPTPTVSSITVTSPTTQTYVGNPITFSGLYTNVHTFDNIEFSLENSNFAGSIYFPNYPLPFTTTIDSSWSISKNLGFLGNYTFKARLKDSSNGSTTPWTSPVSFSLGTTTIATSTSDTFPGAPLPIDCSSLDIACHLKNALVYIFYPSAESIENFKSLSEDLKTKAPFVYVYQVGELREEMFGASTTPQSISLNFHIIPGHATSTLELLSKSKLEAVPFAGTVKTVLGWILILLGVEYIYYRVIRTHDQTPQ